MAAPCYHHSGGRSQSHLRRIGNQGPASGVVDVIHFWKTVTLIGRKRDVVDYFLSCATPGGRNYMSRIHARVIWTSTYELVDSSLTGVYVNDVRIHGRVVLQEGDTVTFGHPDWQSITPRARARQPNSPFYFLFEHCHCSTNQMHSLHGKSPMRAAAGVSLEAELKAALPQRAQAAPRALPASLSLPDTHHGCCCAAAFPALPPPLTLAASVPSPGTSSPSEDSVSLTSRSAEMPDDPHLGASPCSALEGSVQPTSRIRRSLSPEYEEEMPALEMTHSPLIQEDPGMNGSEPMGGSQEPPAGCMPGSRRLFQHESCSGEAGTSHLHAVCLDHIHASLPTSTCPEDSVAADCGSSSSGTQVIPAELPEDVRQLARSVQTEEGGNLDSRLSPPGTKEQVSSGSDHSQEIIRMEMDESTEETAKSDTCSMAQPGVQMRAMDLREEAVCDGQVTSAGNSQDRRTGKEGTVEGHDELFIEMPLPEDALQETEREVDGSVTDRSLANGAENIAAETSDLLSAPAGSRTPDGLLCGQEPGSVSPMRLVTAAEVGSRAPTVALPCEIQSGHGAGAADTPENASDDEDDAETLPYINTRLLATDCPLGPRDSGSEGPAMESGTAEDTCFAEISRAEAGTQSGGMQARETRPATAEERGSSSILEVLQRCDSRFNTQRAKETLRQQLPKASASDFPTQEGEFSEERVIIAMASSDSSSDSLLETCKEDQALAAAASPAGMGWGKEPHEADLPEQPMDLDGRHFGEHPSQRRETFTEGMRDESTGAVAAERELEDGGAGLARMDTCTEEAQLVASRLGCEEGRHERDGTACVPLAASPGAGEPDSLHGRESEGEEEVRHEGASGREGSQVPRGEGVARAFRVGAAVAEGGLENQPERSAGNLGGGATHSASSSAHGHAWLLPPFPSPGAALGEEGSPHSLCGICVGTGLSFQRSEQGAGGRLESGNSHLSPKQGDLEDEQGAALNDDMQAMAQGCAVGTEALAVAQWHREMTEPEKKDAQVARQADSTRPESREASPLPQDCQEPELHAGGPQGLEGGLEVKPLRADVEQVSLPPDDLPVEGDAWEEVCEPGVSVEYLTPPRPEGCREEVLVPEQGKGLQQSLGGSCCRGLESNFSQGLCSARTLQEGTARNLPRENQMGSAVAPESFSSEDLNLYISNSEVKREENDNSQVRSNSGREAVIPKERDPLVSDSVEHLDGVNEGREGTEQCATCGQCEAASQEMGGGPSEAVDMLQEQNASCPEPCCDENRATVAVPQTSIPDMAFGEKSPSPAKAAVLQEELADQAAEGTELGPLSLLHASEKDLCLLESDARLGGGEQAPGGRSGRAEEVGSALLEGGGTLDSRFADQPGLGTLETSETPEENLQSETPTSICAEGLEGVQKMEGKALLPLKEETEPLRSQDDESQRENGPGCSDRLASAACGRTPFAKEEAAEGCSARKRHSGGEQALGTPDSEKGSSSRKRRCLLDSGSGLQPSTQRLATPLDLERRREQFDRTVGKFLQQYSSRTALPSEDAEGKNRDSIAQIVRTYFTSALGLEEPGAESLEAERSARPLEAGISEDADCKPAARAEPEKRAGSSPTLNEATSWDPSPRGACSAASPLSQSLGSHTQQPGREATCHVPESVRKAYSSEEEEFQSSISSVLKHSPLNYPVALPRATCVQESCGKNVDLVFSDISSSSVESEGSEPSPDSKSSTGIGRGCLWGGMLSEAAETGLALGGASCLPKPPDVGWCAEDRSASSGTCVSSHKSIQLPKGDFPVESGGHVDVVGDDADAPVLQQVDGTFDGEGDHKAPGTGAPQVTSCLISSVGETREEPDHSPSEMHIEDAALLQRSHEDSPSQGEPWPREDRTAQKGRIGRGEGAESSLRRAWASSEQDIAFQLQECHSVLEEISQSLRSVEGIDDMHMKKWRDQIAELQKATKMPKTYIAVVGNTGAGKSSLLNALLDEEAVLPTSAMRACTAVVVEISRAAGGQPYEADVEFLSREEWLKELNALLEDMKDKSGNLKKRCPDRKTEAGAAYSRVKAVYGRVDKAAALEVQQDVTQHLGTVKHISAETAADFRANIEKFIDSRTDNLRDMKGGEFWPIVKCVRIRVARAEVLKTGVVLVDLPGVRDSNAARDDAAKEYLKSCNAVWVVASITRAVDDKTAKEILNINLRRQLFMDGQFGNLAFICTKTDSFNITDIVRDLDLRKEIQPLEEELEELEAQRMRVEEEKGTLHWALQPEQRQGVDATNPAWLQRQHDFLEKEFQMSSLQKQKDAKLRAISLVCVQARNRFSKQRIRMDFNTGLEELKKKAEFSECDNDGDEDMEDGDFASSDAGDLGEAESEHEKLHVFTVSSTEYLKLSGKLLRDGPPQVFHDPKDTEIPALKSFAIETGMKNSMKATEKVIRDVARVISETVNYLTSQRAEDISHQASVQGVVQQSLQDVPRLLQEAVDDVLPDIQYCFGVLIKTSLQKGSNIAKELCEDIVKSWGLPDTGFSHATYHAACVRHGVYSSPKSTCVDFNGRLAQPVYDTISTAWNEVFSSKVVESLNHFAKAVLDKLKTFFRDLQGKLRQQSSITEALRALRLQQMEAFQARLCNFLLEQEEYIRARQRTISRLLTPSIQAGMAPAYVECSRMSGPGYFQRMKNKMESHVRNNKDSIFDSATGKLQWKLQKLQQNIQSSSQSLVRELNGSLRMQFEPLLKPVQRNARIIPELMSICAKVDKICKRSCVDYVLPSTPQVEAGSPEAEKAPQGDPPCFSALCLDLRLGAVPLPHVASIQVSGQDLALTLADETTVVLPLSSISLCESCRPLGCLILHIASESAREICRSCRVEASLPGQWGQEALVILDKARDQRMFSSLVAQVSSSCRDASWFQALSLHQGRERLESLGVSCTVQQSTYDAEKLLDVPADPSWLPQVVTVVQQPQLIQVNLQPYGGKRVGEALQPVPEKRHKSRASAQEAGPGPGRQPPPSWSTEGKMAPYGQSAMPRHLPASRERVPENCRWNRGQLLGAAQLSMPASELTLMASPGSTGACTRAEEGKWWKRRDPDTKGDSEKPRAAE